MKKNAAYSLFFYLLTILFPGFSLAKSLPQWQMIPEKSHLTFTATQNGAPVSGEFKRFSAEIFADPTDYRGSTLHIVVEIASLSTSYSDLSSTLMGADWFNTKMFPTADFRAGQFNKTGDNTYEAHGILIIRNKSVPITLNFTAQALDNKTMQVTGETTLKRRAFSVGEGEWASTDEIKDDVVVNFTVVAVPKP